MMVFDVIRYLDLNDANSCERRNNSIDLEIDLDLVGSYGLQIVISYLMLDKLCYD